MVLVLETCVEGSWRQIGCLTPSDRPGSLSNNKEGKREVYVFVANGPDLSTIYRSKGGVDIATHSVREVQSGGYDLVKELRRSDPLYEMLIKTDQSDKEGKIRFRHI